MTLQVDLYGVDIFLLSDILQLLARLIQKLCEGEPSLKPDEKDTKDLDACVMALNDVLSKLKHKRVVVVVDGVDKLRIAKKAQKVGNDT